jgi:CHRD domain-containing protein
MRRTASLAVAALAALVLTALAYGAAAKDVYRLSGTLTAVQEVPKPTGAKAGAGGTFTSTLTEGTNGGTLAWKLTFKNLTGKAVAAHVHVGARGKSGNVLVPLCAAPARPCRSGMTGRTHVNHTTFDALEKRATYVNVHTARNPAGEIRAQLKVSQP